MDRLTCKNKPNKNSDFLKNLLLNCSLAGLILYTRQGSAHTSEQGFVLLLPTNVYISGGVIAVALTVLILAVLPSQLSRSLFASKRLFKAPVSSKCSIPTSLLSLVALITLITIGFIGSHDPVKNMLPLVIWTVWWIGFVCLQGVFGNLWHWINPWTGLYSLIHRFIPSRRSLFTLPPVLGNWPAVLIYILFSCFALADTAPEDPPRLAIIVSCYFLFTLAGMFLFGSKTWLERCECFTIFLRWMAQLSAVGTNHGIISIGLPGWRLLVSPVTSISTAVFILTLLAIGSFDGLNETFWWLGKIGINPLEFPGRSAVVTQTIFGLLSAMVLLIASFAFCVWAGMRIANRAGSDTVSFYTSFTHLSAAILPIALAYHFAHFLTAFLVNSQYTLAAATDPLQNGRDLLGLGRFYVTTGFFNSRDTVRIIWLTQAGAVVIGHILSVLLAHTIAERLWKDSRKAVLSQIPLAVFMILYTLLGLWLLAAPRGA